MNNIKVAVIAGCSQKKLSLPAPAIELNQGQLFRSIKKLTFQNNFDLKILSGKYGLLEPDQIIEPYNQKIKTKADILRIREKIIVKLCQIWRDYEIIIIIMGGNYRQVLKPFFDNKFYVIFDKRGIGGYLSTVSRYRKLKTDQLLQDIKKFQYLECAEYLWSEWNFNVMKKFTDVNRPHCCFYCTFRFGKECKYKQLYPDYRKKQLEDLRSLQNLSEPERKREKIIVTSKLKSHQKTTLSDF
ncbi:MAG: DUF6884 domain-containing protein [Promethearchaeota archaeon]|jgi:hypothetical protein